MFPLYLLALLIHAVYSITPCHNGDEIVTKETHDPQDLIGNWTTVYRWDNMNKFTQDLISSGDKLPCPTIVIEPVTPEEVKAKEAECSNYDIPFNWADAKFKIYNSHTTNAGTILVIGEKENWAISDCGVLTHFVLNKVPGDYIVMVYWMRGFPEKTNISDMIARRVPTMDDLKCVAHNVDVGKDWQNGFEVCATDATV